MSLIGMSKETYQKILDEVNEIYYLINLNGKFENVLAVEKILMERHNLTVDDTRSFIHLSFCVDDIPHKFSSTGPVWIADRLEPQLADYPEVAELLSK